MSAVDDRRVAPEPGPEWERLERLAEEAALAVGFWKRRALEAEEEVTRLRGSLENLSGGAAAAPRDLREELRRVKAENAALRSRLGQARQRVQSVLRRLVALGIDQ